VIIAIILTLAGFLVLDLLSDRFRIQDEIESKGGHVVKIKWHLFGPDGDWDTNNRFYLVTYMILKVIVWSVIVRPAIKVAHTGMIDGLIIR
jgi:hypothetical protein